MATLLRLVKTMRSFARHASDKRRFRGWYGERQRRRGR